MKVGLPQELMHLEWIPGLKRELNGKVADVQWVHTPSSQGTSRIFLDGDACYPFKKIVRTALALWTEVDVLLVPRIVSLDGFLMCPNFRALPDIIAINRERVSRGNQGRLIQPTTEINNNKDVKKVAEYTVQEILDTSKSSQISEPPEQVGLESPLGTTDISRLIALIGHPYVLKDPKLNSGVPEILSRNGFETVGSHQIPFQELESLAGSRDYYAKTLYWRPAREALGAFLYFTTVSKPAGIIQMITFNCGVEALLRIELMSLYKQMDNPPPYLILVCDEHTQREHLVTRIEAFVDMVNGINMR